MLNLEMYLEQQNAFTKAASKTLLRRYSEDELLYIEKIELIEWLKEQNYSSKRTIVAIVDFINGFKKQLGKQELKFSEEEIENILCTFSYDEAVDKIEKAIAICKSSDDELMLKLILRGFDIETIVSLTKNNVTKDGLNIEIKGNMVNYIDREIALIANKLKAECREDEYLYKFALGTVKRNASMSTRLKRTYSIEKTREIIGLMRLKQIQNACSNLNINIIINCEQGQICMALYGLNRRSLSNLIETYKNRL